MERRVKNVEGQDSKIMLKRLLLWSVHVRAVKVGGLVADTAAEGAVRLVHRSGMSEVQQKHDKRRSRGGSTTEGEGSRSLWRYGKAGQDQE